jgi:hydroxymethylglutaryl-CoA reductase (NADPH)
LNYVVLAVFVGSITYVCANYRRMTQASASPLINMFFPIMVLWGMCLVYFFGFFGISFVDTHDLMESPETFGLGELDKQTKAMHALATQGKSAPGTAEVKSASKPKAMNDGPICSDPARPAAPAAEPTESIENVNFAELSDDEVFDYLSSGALKDYQLEKKLGDYERAVSIRRRLYENVLDKKLDLIPYAGYDYGKVFGANCEIVIGYVPLPLGVVGPLVINGEPIYIPMATTEGCLVASTNRGCKAMYDSCYHLSLHRFISLFNQHADSVFSYVRAP